ncbi:hypothetical protein SDJN03_05217, partial [Cucurbita argyrosperma subsp. sororia]
MRIENRAEEKPNCRFRFCLLFDIGSVRFSIFSLKSSRYYQAQTRIVIHAPKCSVNGEIPDPLDSDYRPSTILPIRISKKRESSAIGGAALLSESSSMFEP